MSTHQIQPSAGAMRAATIWIEPANDPLHNMSVVELATLIDRETAAPELLAVLKRCHGLFQQSPLNKHDGWVQSKLARDIRAAIAKAEGKAS